MITIEVPEVTIIDPDTNKAIAVNDSIAGIISQALANGVVQALKEGAGYTIREEDVEINVTMGRVSVTEKTETYIGR